MPRKARSQTPQDKPIASSKKVLPQEGLGGDNPRGEVAGCPTGLAANPQAQQPQQAGGGGAPGTGASAQSGHEVIEKEEEKSEAND